MLLLEAWPWLLFDVYLALSRDLNASRLTAINNELDKIMRSIVS